MTTKLTPDQLHRLIDEVAELAYRKERPPTSEITSAMWRHGAEEWWSNVGRHAYVRNGCGFAGLSAVLILLSEGG